MSVSRKRATRVFSVSFPEDMAQQVAALADEESRTISELFREAFRMYRIERRMRMLDQFRAEANARNPVKHKPRDIERLVDEVRAEMAAERKKTA